jgi:hypothetical protein
MRRCAEKIFIQRLIEHQRKYQFLWRISAIFSTVQKAHPQTLQRCLRVTVAVSIIAKTDFSIGLSIDMEKLRSHSTIQGNRNGGKRCALKRFYVVLNSVAAEHSAKNGCDPAFKLALMSLPERF